MTTARAQRLTLARSLGAVVLKSSALETRARAAGLRRRLRRQHGGAALTAFDPLDPAVIADPYPAYRALLAGGPVHHNRRRGLWIISRYEDVRAAGRAHDRLSSAEGVTPVRARIPMLLTVDRPQHTRLRKLVSRDFTAAALERWRPLVQELATTYLDALMSGGGDYVSTLAEPLPTMTIAHAMGVPPADAGAFRTWSDQAVEGFGVGGPGTSLRTVARTLRAASALNLYFAGQREQRLRCPADDLLGKLCVATPDRDELTADEFFWFALLLLLAGNETTTSLLGTMALTFAQHPEAFEQVRSERSLAPGAIEECLRHVAPIQGMYRAAIEDYTVGDVTIPRGARVLLLFGAANRDPRKFADPDRFDVTRDTGDHIAFGSGIHFCLGAHLARLEGQVVLDSLLDRVERIELAGQPRWGSNPSLRGPAHLPVRLVPRR